MATGAVRLLEPVCASKFPARTWHIPLAPDTTGDAQVPGRKRPARRPAQGAHAHVRREYWQERRRVQGWSNRSEPFSGVEGHISRRLSVFVSQV